MEVDAIARVDDAPVIDKVLAGVQQLGMEETEPVVELTPQARALAAVAAAAKREKQGDWDVLPHPMLEKGTPTRQQFDEPDTTPVVLMRNPIAGPQVIDGTAELDKPVPINTVEPLTVDSPLFYGKIHIHVRGLKNSRSHIFEGKKRFVHLAWQGRFKRDIKASDFWNGHEWFTVSEVVPTSFVNIAYTAAAKMFSSTTRVCPSTQNGQIAGFLNPVLASCQLVNVAQPGSEPPMWGAHEDVRLLCDELVDKNGDPMASEKRRRWFDNPANAAKVVISKDYVYTWHVWQHWCNISNYRLQLNSLLSFDLCQFSEGQPMQIMCKDQSTGEYSCNLLLWHKRLLYNEEPEEHSIRGKIKSLKDSWKGLVKSSKA